MTLGDDLVTFTRLEASNWTHEVPGARWFKADLHIHTIDDHPGKRAKIPPDLEDGPFTNKGIEAYARRFLQSAVARSVRVIGITPHSPRFDPSKETSAVWQIVEEWNNGNDDDGVPFREKIYAIFPGFEPSLNDGKSGLHLIFLFDPEIGRTNYLRAFDLVMGAVWPWPNEELRMSNRRAEQAFQDLRKFQARESTQSDDGIFHWNYIVLAPHIENDKGLLGAQKAQVLQLFEHNEVAALELSDNKLPDNTVKDRPWLQEGMDARRQAFLHGSDAYTIEEIGRRHTWVKLASPKIEGLRQAFIAGDSRVRIGYRREANGDLEEITDPPDVTMYRRPWLKSVTVSGKASFFGNGKGVEQGNQFDFSPDLTCIIGGSMTGKSTLLDGLRVHVAAQLPKDESAKRQVESRANIRFLSGSAVVDLDCPGSDPTAAPHEQWPAVFYTQTELQRLAEDSEAREDILARLLASETLDITARETRLRELDEELTRTTNGLSKLGDEVAVAEQALQRSQKAAEELAAFSDSGAEKLNDVSSYLSRWRDTAAATSKVENELDSLLKSLLAVEIPEMDDDLTSLLEFAGIGEEEVGYDAQWDSVRRSLKSAKDELGAVNSATKSIVSVLKNYKNNLQVQVEQDLADRGVDGAIINQLQEVNAQASLLESRKAHLDKQRKALRHAERVFNQLRQERSELVKQQRNAFDRVIGEVSSQFGGRIRARRIDEGRKDTLDCFLSELKQKGITRWWNDLAEVQRPTPDGLLLALKADQLENVGMSPAVKRTFTEQLTPSKRHKLASLRCPDDYVLELMMEDGSYRPLRDLSGGQRVNLLLSLLLETTDDRPLVIDQPEDELDNRFLFDTLLPALKRLKGRRQIILATHDANIVVNGDADQVILLQATANHGHVACSGAIEEPAVRKAIVKTVDGGDEAFRLRRLKYGF